MCVCLQILEEMPEFPEKESSLLAKLKKSKPQLDEIDGAAGEKKSRPTAIINNVSCLILPECASTLSHLQGSSANHTINNLVDVEGKSTTIDGKTADPLADVFAATSSTVEFVGGDETLTMENKDDVFK